MLSESLYRIKSFEYDLSSGVLNAVVQLNKDHPVFNGHFPGNPILPGVCTIEIAKELLCKALNAEFRLKAASNIKYLGFVNPVISPRVDYAIIMKQNEKSAVNCSVTVIAGENTVCSFRGEYVQI